MCARLAPLFTCGQHVVQHVVDLNRLDPWCCHFVIYISWLWCHWLWFNHWLYVYNVHVHCEEINILWEQIVCYVLLASLYVCVLVKYTPAAVTANTQSALWMYSGNHLRTFKCCLKIGVPTITTVWHIPYIENIADHWAFRLTTLTLLSVCIYNRGNVYGRFWKMPAGSEGSD
jgi:hypothetical protein